MSPNKDPLFPSGTSPKIDLTDIITLTLTKIILT